MNLAVDCMQVFSGRPLASFKAWQEELFVDYFGRALGNPALKPWRRELDEILEFAQAHSRSEAVRKNPEAFYPAEFLSRSKDPSCFPFLIELLRLQLGMKPIRRSRGLPEGYYRLTRVDGGIYRADGGKISKVYRPLVWKMKGFAPDVFLPHNGLFSDFLNHEIYPDMKAYDAEVLKEKLVRTLEIMKEFSKDIHEDFQSAVWNLVLLTNTPRYGLTGLTMRYKYFGGIFYNPFLNDEYSGTEGLMHEYIHNRCWLWWDLVPPTGVPPESVRIVSPVTGAEVKVSAMIHAFIIYVCGLQFYRHIQETNPPRHPAQRRKLNRRAAHLSRNMPILNRRLCATVKRGTVIRKLFEYLMAVYEDLERDR